MQVQRISNSSYNTNFGARYVVKGSKKEIDSFMRKLRENINARYSSGQAVLKEDFFNAEEMPLNVMLEKKFGEAAKDVKQYEAKEILNNPNFDFFEGIIK